jgi:hypothetical protein
MDVRGTGQQQVQMIPFPLAGLPRIPFVHMSTNKVYGDAPNRIPLQELPTVGKCLNIL